MNKKFVSAVLLATLFGVASASASAQDQESGGYIGVNYVALDTESGPLELSTPVILLVSGYQVNSFFAVEGRIGFGVGDDSTSFSDGSTTEKVSFEIGNYLGIFARFGILAHPRFYPYVMLGYGDAELETSNNSFVVGGSDTDIAYGIGANIGFTDKLFGKVEYMNYFDGDATADSFAIQSTGFGIGLSFKF